MNLAGALARLEGVRRCAGGYVARCPAHSDREASLSVHEGKGGKVLLKCFAGCSFEAIRAALEGWPPPRSLGLPASNPRLALDDTKRTEISRRIWRESKPAAGTLVEIYLRSRGIVMPVPPTLSFHCALKHPTGAYLPAMVAAVERVRTGTQIVAVHRTWLRPDGLGKADVKPPKAALGPIAGGEVRLAPAGETLALAEGIETALSIQQATGLPTWATCGTSNLCRIELPDCVREVVVCADPDPAGGESRARSGRALPAGRT